MLITPAACSLAVAMTMSPQPGDHDDQVIEDLKAQVASLQQQCADRSAEVGELQIQVATLPKYRWQHYLNTGANTT